MTISAPTYFVGVSLGGDGSQPGLAVLERRRVPTEALDRRGHRRTVPHYAVRYLERGEAGASFTTASAWATSFSTRREVGGEPIIVLDATGLGAAVVDLFSQTARGWVVAIRVQTGQGDARGEWGHYDVPLTDLVSVVRVLLETRRLRIARELPDGDVLVQQLQTFHLGPTELRVARDHLAAAVALPCWYAEQGYVEQLLY